MNKLEEIKAVLDGSWLNTRTNDLLVFYGGRVFTYYYNEEYELLSKETEQSIEGTYNEERLSMTFKLGYTPEEAYTYNAERDSLVSRSESENGNSNLTVYNRINEEEWYRTLASTEEERERARAKLKEARTRKANYTEDLAGC